MQTEETVYTILPIEDVVICNEDKRLDLFKKLGSECIPTDYAVLTSSIIRRLKDECLWWSSSADNLGNVQIIDDNGKHDSAFYYTRVIATRPASKYPDTSKLPKPIETKRKYFIFKKTADPEFLRIQNGELPQKIVDKRLNTKLEDAFNKGHLINGLICDGVTYASDGQQSGSYEKQLAEKHSPRFIWTDGKKYVRVIAKVSETFPIHINGVRFKNGDVYWCEVQPRTRLIDKKSGKAIDEFATVGDIKFCGPFLPYGGNFKNTNLFNYLNSKEEWKDIGYSEQVKTERKPLLVREIPQSLNEIAPNAFNGCIGLREIIIPESIKEIGKNAFQYCTGLEKISYKTKEGTYTYNIPENEEINNIVIDKNGLVVITQNPQKELSSYTSIRKDGNIITLSGLDTNCYNHLFQENKIDQLFEWSIQKQKSKIKATRESRLPSEYFIKALGSELHMIDRYYQTRAKGISQIEKKIWFEKLPYEAKINCIRIFVSLGGFENSEKHQREVVEWFKKFTQDPTIHTSNEVYYSLLIAFFNHERFQSIPIGINHIQEEVTESNVINGFEQSTVKLKSYHRQILSFFKTQFQHRAFSNVASHVLTQYPKIYKEYRTMLRETNEEDTKYKTLKEKGIDVDFVLDYKTKKRFDFYNPELKPVQHLFRNQDDATQYDNLMRQAKKKANEILANPKKDYSFFASGIQDTENNGIIFSMPPITDPVALTSGRAFGTCFSCGGENEAALINIFAEKTPQDKLMLLFNESRLPIAYCRFNYDRENQGILIDIIEFNKNSRELVSNREQEIWKAIKRGLLAQMQANNSDGKNAAYPIKRINCKHDPYNRLMNIIADECPEVNKFNAPELQERCYMSSKGYYYHARAHGKQRLVFGPELKKSFEKKPNNLKLKELSNHTLGETK